MRNDRCKVLLPQGPFSQILGRLQVLGLSVNHLLGRHVPERQAMGVESPNNVAPDDRRPTQRRWQTQGRTAPILRLAEALALLITCCLLTGCGNSNPLGRVAITGTVTLDGQPMDEGSIRFRPVERHGIGSGAPIRDGHYQIETSKGLPPGEYVVRLSSPVRFGDARAPEGPPGPESMGMINGVERVPEQYNAKSTLRVTVEAKGDNVFDYAIEAKKNLKKKR